MRAALTHCASYDASLVADKLAGLIREVLPDGGEPLAGRRILLKPNLLSAREPERGVTTHPAVVGAAIDYFRERGAVVSVGDSPGGAVRGVGRVWENTGMAALCSARGVDLINFEAGGWEEMPAGGRTYAIAAALKDVDFIVNLAKFKTHVLTLLTGAVKNTLGCVPGFHKSALHLKYPSPNAMSRAVVDVFSLVRPWLNIIDAVESMDRNGPSSGRVVRTGLMGASLDAVALDAVFAHLVGLRPLEVPVIREAARRGLGIADLRSIDLAGGSPDDFRLDGFEVPSNWAFRLLPGILGSAVQRFLWVRPRILGDVCTGCRLCADMCPAGAISFECRGGAVDAKKCRSCLCCHEACPEGAIEVQMSRLVRLVA